MIHLLNTLFSGKKSADEVERVLQDDYSIPVTYEMGKEVKHMCNLSERIEEMGIQKGLRTGREEGGSLMVYSLVQDGDLSAEKGASRLGVTIEELRKRMALCGYQFPNEI